MDFHLLKKSLSDPALFTAIHDRYPSDLIQSELQLLSAEDRSYYKQIFLDKVGMRVHADTPSLVNQCVYISSSLYGEGGQGVVEVDRGYGTLRVLEVRMPNKKIRIIPVESVRMPNPWAI